MTHIKQRRDTASNWTTANPVLMLGEVGWETNTRKSKLGDGVAAWNDLPYSTAPPTTAAVTSVNTRTGAVVLDRTDVGLDNVNNTSDANKPVSTATAAALLTKADLASPVFTGNPTAPTPSPGDNDTSIATTAFVTAALAATEDPLTAPLVFSAVAVTAFTKATYPGMKGVRVRVIGSGGGSGGCAATAAGEGACAAGGGAGGYAEGIIPEASLASSENITITAAGTAGAAGNNSGGAGGTNSFGAFLTATGGGGGAGSANSAANAVNSGGNGGVGGGTLVTKVTAKGSDGGTGMVMAGLRNSGGFGGSSMLGGSTRQLAAGAGQAGSAYGGGASGAQLGASTAAAAGAAGGVGAVIVEVLY